MTLTVAIEEHELRMRIERFLSPQYSRLAKLLRQRPFRKGGLNNIRTIESVMVGCQLTGRMSILGRVKTYESIQFVRMTDV